MSEKQGKRWHNWSGSVTASPRQFVQPHTIAELAALVSECGREGRHVRVVGTGHSFTPLVQTDDLLISLDNLQGIEEVDVEGKTVTVLGGTKLKHLGAALLAHGLSQENLGDIDEQSLAGAISTGTHGTGIRFGTLSTQVEGLTLLTATGDLLECSPTNHPEIFKAAQLSLGMLGIIVKIKLRVVPARRLRFQSHRESLDSCLSNLERYKQENTHFEFYGFPYTRWVQAKFLNETEDAATGSNLWGEFNKVVLENWFYWLLSEGCRLLPGLTKPISKFSTQALASVVEVDYSHRLYATMRVVRFQEMEYNLPAEHFTAALTEILACIEQQQFKVHFPIECRFVHSDDIWLSPAHQRESAYIAVHMYRGMAYEAYFRQVEEIFKRYGGRPHWGKMHTRTAEELAALYPRWQDFRRVRASLDPQGVFLNQYLRALFAADAPVQTDVTPGQIQGI